MLYHVRIKNKDGSLYCEHNFDDRNPPLWWDKYILDWNRRGKTIVMKPREPGPTAAEIKAKWAEQERRRAQLQVQGFDFDFPPLPPKGAPDWVENWCCSANPDARSQARGWLRRYWETENLTDQWMGPPLCEDEVEDDAAG